MCDAFTADETTQNIARWSKEASPDGVVDAFREHLHLPDPGVVLVVAGVIAANRLPGDPVWLLLVGPPSSGKSEIVNSTTALSDTHEVATFTEGGLLSGTKASERTQDATGGLLREIGDFGIIVAKDFGSVMSMNRDSRSAGLAALREIYDGKWSKVVGTDGGHKLVWEGKVGLIAAVTEAWDKHHAVTASMGERFTLFRIPAAAPGEVGRRSLANVGHEDRMRSELSKAMVRLFEQPMLPTSDLTATEEDYLVRLTRLVVTARSSVERSGTSREVTFVHQPESPARAIKQFDQLRRGMEAIGVDRATRWRLVTKVAFDSVPAPRMKCLQAVYEIDKPVSTADVAARLGLPTTTTGRLLEELNAHGLAKRTVGISVDLWSMSSTDDVETVTEAIGVLGGNAVPETSEGPREVASPKSQYPLPSL